MTTQSLTSLPLLNRLNPDRIGVWASVLCAIHCLLTPFLLLALPTFGSLWAHPLSHLLIAMLVVPLALSMVVKGYKKHSRKWILASGVFGVLLVLAGAAYPYATEPELTPVVESAAIATTPLPLSQEKPIADESCKSCLACGETCTDSASTIIAKADEPIEPAVCMDACCPSLSTTPEGETRLQVPPAAIITTLGGIFLIAAHAGNLVSLRTCVCDCKC